MKFNFSLTDFLKNNKELTISIETSNNNKNKTNTNSNNSNINNNNIHSTNNNNDYKTNNLNTVDVKDGSEGESTSELQSPNNLQQLSEITIEKRNRKQTQPRKIEKAEESSAVTSIRDKHMIRLVSRRKCCRLCKHNNYSNYYHSITSLILHTYWRHSENRFKCRMCKEKFPRRYKLNLHLRLKHDIIIDY